MQTYFTSGSTQCKINLVISRDYWIQRLHSAWEKAPIAWLSGVRRVGKTTLVRGLPGAEFLNCDLPSTVRRLENLELFFASLEKPMVIFDEIHQLEDPSRILKVAADEFPRLRILATGSSTLAATKKFRDSLTGRKRAVHLLPVLELEIEAFGAGLTKRLHHGGLPEALLADKKDPEFFAEWLDSFYARDVQELFRVGKRQAFLNLVELLLRTSGGMLSISSLSKHTGLSRPTVMGYLEMLQLTHIMVLIRPFHGGGRQEILHQPKCYGFDTGFVSFFRGWNELREEDYGSLWEHLVLETLQAHSDRRICYWRDKQKREIDFVLPTAAGNCDAIECKWNVDSFSARSLRPFRDLYPQGQNFVLSPIRGEPFVLESEGVRVVVCNLSQWRTGAAQELWNRSTKGSHYR
jgi:predicted AAA+ superfamily ATPase